MLVDNPKSMAKVFVLLKNVERVQVAMGQIHEEMINVNDKAEDNKKDVSKCIEMVSETLKELHRYVPRVELSRSRIPKENP